MLTTNYSTSLILTAANVIDGGKPFSEVPAASQPAVAELMKTLGADASTADETTPTVAQVGVVNTQPIVESDDKEDTIDLVKGTKEEA